MLTSQQNAHQSTKRSLPLKKIYIKNADQKDKFAATMIAAVLFLFLINGVHCFVSGVVLEDFQKLSPQCCANPPTMDPASGVGHVEKLAGFNVYVSGSLECKHAVLLASDIFGYETPNLRNIADKVAAAGFYAVVPDFFYGEPFVADKPDRPKDAWLKDHTPEKAFKDAKLMVDALKSKGISSIGAAGFCWGAKPVVELTKIADIKAAVIFHPSFVTLDDINCVKVPIAIMGGELDKAYPATLLKQFDDTLRANGVASFVKIFTECRHGFAIRYNVSDPTALSRANEAHQDMLEWFAKHVK